MKTLTEMPKLSRKQKSLIDEEYRVQEERAERDLNWQKMKKALNELGIEDGDLDDADDESNIDTELSILDCKANDFLRGGKNVPYNLKIKILRKTRPELFNSDGTPKVDISKLGNIE